MLVHQNWNSISAPTSSHWNFTQYLMSLARRVFHVGSRLKQSRQPTNWKRNGGGGGGWGAVGPRVCSSGTRKWIAELISWEQMQFEWSASLTHMFGPPTYEKTKLESHTASMATIIYTFKWTFSFISHARTKMQLDDGFFVHNVLFFFGASRFKTWLNWAERTSSFFFFLADVLDAEAAG